MSAVLQPRAEGAPDKRALLAAMLRKQASEKFTSVPLSHGQKALWFLHQSAKDSAAYNVAFAVRIRSALDVEALRRSFQKLVDRHAMLRARFVMRGGELVQEVAGYREVAFALTEGERGEAALQAQVEQAYKLPFDLENGPLLRVELFRRGPNDHVLLVAVSHIVYDGWSLWQNLDEIGKLYAAEVAGGADVPATFALPTSATYGDYVRRQQRLLDDAAGDKLWGYWKQYLAGDLPVLNLPSDRVRPPVQSYRGASHKLALERGLALRLAELAKSRGVSLFTLLLASFQVLLHRHAGQDQVLIGVPTVGQREGAFAEVVGYFVNPVVVKAEFGSGGRFTDCLAAAHQNLMGALEHQDYPFPLLVERLRPRRDSSHSPLFQASFAFQRAQHKGGLLDLAAPGRPAGATAQWGSLQVEHFDLAQQEGQFDIELELINVGEDVFGSFKYSTDLFDAATIARLAQSFDVMLHSIADDPEQEIGRISILSDASRAEVLGFSSVAAREFGELACLHDTFAARVRETPHAPAVACEGRTLSYAELDGRAESLAVHLQTLGVGPDVLVGLCVERSWEMMVGVLGILKAGGAYVPLDPSSPAARRAFIIEDSAAPVLVTQHALAGQFAGGKATVVSLDADWPAIEAAGAGGKMAKRQAGIDNLAYVIYTSGTTGQPKGALITHRNVARLFAATDAWYGFGRSDVWTMFHSLAFDFSVWEIWGALLYGGKLVVVPYLVSRSPSEFRALVSAEGVTVLNQTPSAFRLFMQSDAASDESLALRLVIFGGEALDIQGLKPWFERHGDTVPQLVNMYGITETTVHVTYRPVSMHDLASVKSVVGVPIPDLRIYILDALRQPVPIGVVGELHVGGAGLARGYFRRAELDAQRFVEHAFEPGRPERLYRSGDLGRYLPNGDIEYMGRLDNQVKIRGFRIELGEIEATIGSHPAVAAAAVTVQRDQKAGDRLVAYVVAAERLPNLTSLLRAHLAARLPDYMVPASLVMIESFPLTGNGKIDFRALPLPQAVRDDGARALVPPRDAVERKLVKLWEGILERHPIGVEDDFFDLGGHSLLAVYLMAELEREFGRKLPLAALFKNPTIDKLGELLRDASAEEAWSPVVPIREEGERTPLFCVAGGGGNVLYFHALATLMPGERPFYGLQAIGLDGRQAPLSRVEDLAAAYVAEIRKIQPYGPYLLGGHCFGAWVAFEMAQQLLALGEQVERVVVLDAPAPLPQPERAGGEAIDEAAWMAKFGDILSESAGQDLGVRYEDLRCLGAEAQLAYFKDKMEQAGMLPKGTALDQVRGYFRVFVQNSKIIYAPRHTLPVKVALFKAGEQHPDYDYGAADDPGTAREASSLSWRLFSDAVPGVHTVPGNHITMMSEPHVAGLAAKLHGVLHELP